VGYATIIESMDQGYCRLDVLQPVPGQLLDARILEVNPAFQTHTGWSDCQGLLLSEAAVVREPFWSRAFEQVLADGQMLHATLPVGAEGRSYETCIIRLGGAGSRQLAVLLKDITARILAIKSLKESESRALEAAQRAESANRRLAAVIEATPAAVVVADPDYRIVLMNSAARELRGNSPEFGPVTARSFWADGSEREGQPLEASDWPLSRALQGHVSRQVIQIDSPEGDRSHGIFLASAAPILGPESVIEGAVVVSTNITDRVMAERSLKLANARKDDFLAMLAHELRNPLAPIVAAAQWMAQPAADLDEMRKCSAIIARQARHLSGLIDDLLDVSRVNRGHIEIERVRVDLGDLLKQALEQSHPLFNAMHHAVRLELSSQALMVRGDAKRIVQILSNLLTNAAKYTPAGGWVGVSTRLQGDWVEIEVTDEGIGMSQETLATAFDLFTQADRSVDRQQGGLGIGLALVKRLVQLHGGQVWAASPGLGLGSTFTVRLPLDASPDPVESVQTSVAATTLDKQARRILVVDDNVDAAKTLAMLLGALGHRCEVAHDAQSALQVAQRVCPDTFILDIGLPGMDGRQLASRLRQDPQTRQARLVALSGYAQPHEQQLALAAGFDHYLVKPVDVERLIELL
jgi:signal transduction histidine kinase